VDGRVPVRSQINVRARSTGCAGTPPDNTPRREGSGVLHRTIDPCRGRRGADISAAATQPVQSKLGRRRRRGRDVSDLPGQHTSAFGQGQASARSRRTRPEHDPQRGRGCRCGAKRNPARRAASQACDRTGVAPAGPGRNPAGPPTAATRSSGRFCATAVSTRRSRPFNTTTVDSKSAIRRFAAADSASLGSTLSATNTLSQTAYHSSMGHADAAH